MRRSQTQHLSHLLRDFIKQANIDDKINEVVVVQECYEILGKTLGKYVKKVSVNNGELFIEVTSALVKSELVMLREELRDRINERMGKEVVYRVILR